MGHKTICRKSAAHSNHFAGPLKAFLLADGISKQPSLHLTNLKAKNGVAHLDRLSVRCLSSYLSFAINCLVIRTQAASRARLGVLFVRRFFLPLPEIDRKST